MSDPDPYEAVTAAWADLAERAVAYTDVWRSAIERNASGAYRAEDLLVDLQTVWGMGVRDVARVGATVVEAMAPLLGDSGLAADGGSGGEGDGEPDEP